MADEMDTQTHRQTQTGRQTDRQKDRQGGCWADRQTLSSATDRQTQTARQTDQTLKSQSSNVGFESDLMNPFLVERHIIMRAEGWLTV